MSTFADIDRAICERLEPLPARDADDGEAWHQFWKDSEGLLHRGRYVSRCELWVMQLPRPPEPVDLTTWDGAGALFGALTRPPRGWTISTRTIRHDDWTETAVDVYSASGDDNLSGATGSTFPLALRQAAANALGIQTEKEE